MVPVWLMIYVLVAGTLAGAILGIVIYIYHERKKRGRGDKG